MGLTTELKTIFEKYLEENHLDREEHLKHTDEDCGCNHKDDKEDNKD